jgi:hypothetical protein
MLASVATVEGAARVNDKVYGVVVFEPSVAVTAMTIVFKPTFKVSGSDADPDATGTALPLFSATVIVPPALLVGVMVIGEVEKGTFAE